MKKGFKLFISTLCAALMAVPVLCAACGGSTEEPDNPPSTETVDYVEKVTLNLSTETKKQEVTVRQLVDGDTTHFDIVKNSTLTPNHSADFNDVQGYIKARYLAINTPESTGKIEPWGVKAKEFTNSKLKSATSIIVESDDNNWNADSTGSRFLLWVWYKPQGGTEYRNLNIEILQEGYAVASNTANNRYGSMAMAALNQAKAQKLHVFAGADPDFDDGAAQPVTLKELRCHAADYVNKSVKVTGVITSIFGDSVYIEEYDPETGVYFGIGAYYGKTVSGDLLAELKIGNEMSLVGKINLYNGVYQVSGLAYRLMSPDNPKYWDYCHAISSDNPSAFAETSVKDIVSGKLDVTFEKEGEDGEIKIETVSLDYGEAIMSTTVSVANLKVVSIYTTDNGGSSDGAMSITCEDAEGNRIVVRTEVLKDSSGNTITESAYLNKTISVKGLIDKYNDSYQIKVHREDYITVSD